MAERMQWGQTAAVVGKSSRRTQSTPPRFDQKYTPSPRPVERPKAEKRTSVTTELEKHTSVTTEPEKRTRVTTEPEKRMRVTTEPEGRVHNSRQEREQRGKFLTRITSLFQFLRDSESEIQKRVNEMDKVGPFTFHFSHPEANMGCSVWRITLCRKGND